MATYMMAALFCITNIAPVAASFDVDIKLAAEHSGSQQGSWIDLLQTVASEISATGEISEIPPEELKNEDLVLDLDFYRRYSSTNKVFDITNMNLNAELPKNISELNDELLRLGQVLDIPEQRQCLYNPLPDVSEYNMEPLDIHSRFRLNAAQSAEDRLGSVKPLAWVHVPKCGSGIINTLVHLPGICPGVPKHLKVNERTMTRSFIVTFMKLYPLATACPGGFFQPHWGTHEGINSMFEEHYSGHGVIMLRQPEQRIISGWYPHDRDLATSQQSWPYPNRLARNINEYATAVSGCATKMLTRDGIPFLPLGHFGGPCGDPRPPSLVEAELAKKRLNAFAFVGLTEEWDLSVCLFRAMYGGTCLQSEFLNTRPGDDRVGNELYDISKLGGYKDPYDGPLYDEAVRMFHERLELYKVTRESCERECKHSVI